MKSKKVLAVLLAVLMLLSSMTVAFSVFAADVAEAASEEAAQEVTYTKEELQEISDKYGYDLTNDQIDAILTGETTLSEAVGDKEEDAILIVELEGQGALAGSDSSEATSERVQNARDSIEKVQRDIQKKIAKKVMKSKDLDVKYSYSLLTNAFAMIGKPSQINEIAAIKGVKSVYTAPIWTPIPTDAEPDAISTEHAANYFTGSDNTTTSKGTGTVVAIIDTGLDCTYSYNSSSKLVTTTFHEAFSNDVENPKLDKTTVQNIYVNKSHAYKQAPTNSNMRTAYKNSIYRSTKVPYAFSYSDDNMFAGHTYNSNLETWSSWSWAFSYFNDDEQGDHGTHVAGITAGYAVDDEGAVTFEGVAPDAQILVMKVFGNKRAGNYADILAAVEDSVLFGADVINLSLGSWAGFSYGGDRPSYDAAFEAAADAGVVVCAAAGNDYTAAKGTLYGNDKALASNPDNGIVSAPGSYDDNLAVASMASKDYYAKSVQIGGRNIAFTNNASDSSRSIEKHAGTTKDYVVLKDEDGNMLTGTDGDFEKYGKKLYGNYVVIRRGQTFTETAQRAADASAIGLIVCDHSDGSLVNMMENTDVKIPAIFISKADGDFILSLESDPATTHKINITNTNAYTVNPDAGKMSDFSSWGVTPDLKLKPEITGYGGNVFSTLKGNNYGLMSGTSMATPYLAGVSALVAQRIKEMTTGSLTSAEAALKVYETAATAANITNYYGYNLTNQYINAIGAASKVKYTEAFKNKIEAARASYDALDAAQQGKVTAAQLKKLTDAEAKWATLEATARANETDNAAADAVSALIAAIDTAAPTAESVAAARTAYDALTAAQKKLVLNLTVLTYAENRLNNPSANAAAVDTLITNIGAVTAFNSATIYKVKLAREAYEKLNDTEKALVQKLGIENVDKRDFAKSVMMSTATPVIDEENAMPYSPRRQGAGLVNIDAALASKAYVTVPGSPTPKLDLGDDKAKTGVYEMTFNVVNIGDVDLTFDVSATVQTEKVAIEDVSYQTRRIDPEKAAAFKETGLEFREKSYGERVYAIDELEDVKFMSGEPYDLTALSTVTANTVTVPAGQTVAVTVTVTLGDDAKAYMDENFVNGIYVEGFIKLTSQTEGQPDLNVPYMGFYGDWTQAPMLDEGTWEDNFLGNPVHPQMAVSTGSNVYWGSMVGYYLYPLGLPNSSGTYNPYDLYNDGATYIPDVRNVFGGERQLHSDMLGAELGLLRSAGTIKFEVKNTQTGEVYYTANTTNVRKSFYYSESVGMVNPGYFGDSDVLMFDGKIQGTQTFIPPGTQVTYTATVLPDYGSEADVHNVNNTFSFKAYYDTQKPTIDAVQCYLDENTGDVMLHMAASDDFFVSEINYAICGYDAGGTEDTVYLHTMFEPEHPGDTVEETINVSEWAREGGLVQVRNVEIDGDDFTQKETENPHPAYGGLYTSTYYLSFFDNVKVSCVTDVLPVGSEAQLNVDFTYGEKLLGGTPLIVDHNNSDFGLEEDFIYSTSNPDVLRVSAEGKLIPVSAGYADVTATGRYGKANNSMRIRVIEDPVQLQIAAANDGDTVTLTEDAYDSSLLINKDIVLDLNGHTIHGIDGYPAIRVIGGNVTIKNGSVDAKFSEDSQNALLTDILEDNAAAIKVEGGNVTLEGLNIKGATFVREGETIIGGSAVVQSGASNLTVKLCDLAGLYAVNNAASTGSTTFVSGNFEGILGSVADMKKVTKSEGSEFIDITNTLAGDDLSYLGTIEGGSASYILPPSDLVFTAEQIAQAVPSENSAIAYDAEKGCATFTMRTAGDSANATDYYLKFPGVNINAEDYAFAAIISGGAPSGFTYHKPSFSNSSTFYNNYLSGELNWTRQSELDGGVYTYVKALSACREFAGEVTDLYFCPGGDSTYGVNANDQFDFYAIGFFNNKADAMSFAYGTANAYTNNLKVAAPQSFNTQLIIDGTTLNVNTSFPDESDGKYKWTANELSLYTRTVNGDNTFNDEFVESKPITPDANGDVSVSFEGIDPSKAYVVKVNFALSLTAEDKTNFFTVSEASASALVKAFPDLLDEMMGVNEMEEAVTNLANFFLYEMRLGFVERDARHYDCPLGPAYAKNYPYIDEYPNIICANSNNSYTTWTAYWDKKTFNEFIGWDDVSWNGEVTRKSYAILFASILGDAKMVDLMANLEESVPAATWEMLDPVLRTGNFGQYGSIPAYKEQLAALKAAAVGATPREELVNGLTYLANNFISLYASVLGVINSLYTPGAEFKSYSDPTANDSLMNVLAGKQITTTYNFGGHNDRQARMIELVDACYAANDYTQNAKAGLMSAMNAALYGTLASYATDAADLMNLYFDSNPIEGGVIDLGRNAEYESEANYDGYIEYELNGGKNNDANPIGYQRLLPVTFAEPTKEGYTFAGWYTTADFADGTEITGTTATTEGDLTVYAKWTINVYTMTFMLGDNVVDTVSYTYGEQTAPTSNLNVTDGLTFKYWYGDDSSKAYDFGPMPAHDVVLKAQLSYMSLDSFDKDGDVYVWPKDDNASLRLTVDRDCVIDFNGKIVSNMNDLAIIVIEKGAKVTIKNAIFAPADYLGTSDENYTIFVDSNADGNRSVLTLENCVVKGAVSRTPDGSFASCSAIKLKNGSLKMNNCVVTGMYAVDNTKYSTVTYTPDVTYGTGVYAGVVKTFVSNTNVVMSTGRVIDASAFVSDAPAADAYANRVIVVAPSEFNVNTFDFEYLPDNDEVQINPVSVDALALPDGSDFTYVPTAAGFDDTVNPLVDGSVTIGGFMVGTHTMKANYSVAVNLAAETAAFIYDLDDALTAAAKAEISTFDAQLPEYDRIITKWNNNKDKIISKFSQYADNALLSPYLKEMREAIDNINGTGTKEGILPRLEAMLDAYKALTTDAQKLAWLLENKSAVIALTIDLRDNVDVIWNSCVMLNALANTFLGADYTDKLIQVKEIYEEVGAHCEAVEKLPSFAASNYAAASDKTAFVNTLLGASAAYGGEKKVEGLTDLGDNVSFTRYIDPTNESFSAPTKFTVLVNSKLSDIVIPDEFPRIEWKTPNTELKELGIFPVAAIYTPTDTVKYNTVEFTIDVEVISPATYCERNGHNYGELIVVQPDCTHDGNATRVCSMCGDVKVEEVSAKLGHIDEDNNNICDRCKAYINDTGKGGVNLILGFLNYISSFLRGVLQVLTRSNTASGTSVFDSDNWLVRFLRWLFKNI